MWQCDEKRVGGDSRIARQTNAKRAILESPLQNCSVFQLHCVIQKADCLRQSAFVYISSFAAV